MLNVYTKKFGPVAILCLQGRIVIGETRTLREAFERLTGITTVLLDLTRVSMIDAAGLGVLLELRQKTKTDGIDLRLMNPTERVSQLFKITRLNTVFETTSPARLLSSKHVRMRGRSARSNVQKRRPMRKSYQRPSLTRASID